MTGDNGSGGDRTLGAGVNGSTSPHGHSATAPQAAGLAAHGARRREDGTGGTGGTGGLIPGALLAAAGDAEAREEARRAGFGEPSDLQKRVNEAMAVYRRSDERRLMARAAMLADLFLHFAQNPGLDRQTLIGMLGLDVQFVRRALREAVLEVENG